MLTTLEGIIADWALVAANTDEREAALDLLEDSRNLKVLGDKGFLDQFRQTLLAELTVTHLYTPKRKNQKDQNAPAWDAQMNRLRRRVETTFAQAKEVFGLETTFARSWRGLLGRLIAKLTGLTVAAHVNQKQGRSPLSLADFSF